MVILYLGQGFIQAINSNATTFVVFAAAKLAMQAGAHDDDAGGVAARPFKFADLEPATLALFSLPVYTFSAKFLWSPIVDAVGGARWRRPIWVVTCQAIICVLMFVGMRLNIYDVVVADSATSLSASSKAPRWIADPVSVRRLIAWLFAIMFVSATQDVAVDAWAVEGVAASNLSYQATAQTIGLVLGFGCMQLSVVVIDKGFWGKTASATASSPQGGGGGGRDAVWWLLTAIVIVQVAILLITLGYVATQTCRRGLSRAAAAAAAASCGFSAQCEIPVVDAAADAAVATNSNIQLKQRVSVSSSSSSVWTTLRGSYRDTLVIFSSPTERLLCLCLLLQGVPHAGWSLFRTEAAAREYLSPSDAALLSLLLIPLSLLIAPFGSALVRKVGAAKLLGISIRLELVLSFVVVMLLLPFAFSNFWRPLLRPNWLCFVVMPTTLSSSIVGLGTSVSIVTLLGLTAKKWPVNTGACLTVLQSVWNFSRSWPSTAALWMMGGRKTAANPTWMLLVQTTLRSWWATGRWQADANATAEEEDWFSPNVANAWGTAVLFLTVGILIHTRFIIPTMTRMLRRSAAE